MSVVFPQPSTSLFLLSPLYPLVSALDCHALSKSVDTSRPPWCDVFIDGLNPRSMHRVSCDCMARRLSHRQSCLFIIYSLSRYSALAMFSPVSIKWCSFSYSLLAARAEATDREYSRDDLGLL